MNPANTAAIAQARVLAVTGPAVGADPMRFLRRAGGGPRGFWARSDRWIAHSGALATVSAEGTHPGGLFSGIEANALALFDPGSVQGVGDASGLRFFGGFAFRPEYPTADLWSGFPPALFHVPALELESVAGEVPLLTVRMLVDPEGGEAESILTRLLTHAERICRELETVGEDGPGDPPGWGPRAAPSPQVPFTRDETERAGWDAAVKDALAAIREGRVSKVVLARTLDLITERRLDPIEVVHHLWQENRGSNVFYFEPEEGCAIAGAAPETVTTVSGDRFHATAVAGTVARGETPGEQKRLAKRLLASEKEGVEHRIALDDMVARLGSLAENVEAQPEPHSSRWPGFSTSRRRSAPGFPRARRPLRCSRPSTLRLPCAAFLVTPRWSSSTKWSLSSVVGMRVPWDGSIWMGMVCSYRRFVVRSFRIFGGGSLRALESLRARIPASNGRKRASSSSPC